MLHEAANECAELSCASVGSVGEVTQAVPVVLHRRFQLYYTGRFQLDYIGGSSWIMQAVSVVWHRRQMRRAATFELHRQIGLWGTDAATEFFFARLSIESQRLTLKW